jgi:small ubiquitin-related modifier
MQLSTTTQFSLLFSSVTKLREYDSFLELISRKRIALPARIERFSEELFRFLFLKALHLNVSPSPVIDQCWHCLLLFPLLYKQSCKILLNSEDALAYEEGIITHDPLGGDKQFARNIRYATALTQYKIYFPYGPIAAEAWPNSYDDGTGARAALRSVKRMHDQIEDSDSSDSDAQPDEDMVHHVKIARNSAAPSEPRSPPTMEPNVRPATTHAMAEKPAAIESNSASERAARGAGIWISLCLRDANTEEKTFYEVKKNSTMRMIMDVHAKRTGVRPETLRFLHDGQRLSEEDTPNNLGIKNGDCIDLFPYVRPATATAKATYGCGCGCANNCVGAEPHGRRAFL